MKTLRFTLILAILMAAVIDISAQSFFRPLPRLQPQTSVQAAQTSSAGKKVSSPVALAVGVTAADSTYGAFRPIMATGYSIPDNHIMAGAGFGYQNITYNYSTQRSYCNWSVNVLGYAGGAIAPTSQGDIVSYGVMIGALNNLVMAGAVINQGKVQAAITFGINFNN